MFKKTAFSPFIFTENKKQKPPAKMFGGFFKNLLKFVILLVGKPNRFPRNNLK